MAPKVFVIDKKGKPLLPTHPARARKLLLKGKARVIRVVPFCIQLKRVVENAVGFDTCFDTLRYSTQEATQPKGSFTIGIDDGAKEVGIAVVNDVKKEVVFHGVIKLRQDVSLKIKQRANFRRTRRTRKLRHRKARFLNRKHSMPQPSIRQRKESIVRVVRDLKKLLKITAVIIEQGQFDVSSFSAGRQLIGTEFQQSEYEGRNFRAKVLWRDEYTCQRCGAKEKLNAHHIMGKGRGGTNTPKNGITLCKKCHDELHQGKWKLDKKPKTFKYPMHLMQGKRYILKLLLHEGLDVTGCLGWMTAVYRKKIKIEKSHPNDAIAMVTKNYMPTIASMEYTILPKRAKVWEDNPTKKSEENMGFRHYDLVGAKHRTKGRVVGSVRSLKSKVMTLRTKFDSSFPVSYRKSTLIQRFNRIIYLY